MKIFFFLLLFINICLFFWNLNMSSPGKEASGKVEDRIDPSVEKIVLVSEVQQLQTTSSDKESSPIEDIPAGISGDLQASEEQAEEKTATEVVNKPEETESRLPMPQDDEITDPTPAAGIEKIKESEVAPIVTDSVDEADKKAFISQ